MITELVICSFVVVLFYLIYEYKQLHYHFAKCGIKFKPGVPIFGNTFKSTFAIKHLIEDIDVVYKAFPNERYVGFMEGMKPVILVRDPELIKSITIKDFNHFVNRKVTFPKEIEPLLESSLMNKEGDDWRKMRTRLTGAFSGSKMRCMMPVMMEISNRIVEYLKGHQFKDIDVLDLMRRYNTDVIASTGFGLHVDSIKDRHNEFITIGEKAVAFTFWRRMYYFLTLQFPAAAKIMQVRGGGDPPALIAEHLGCHNPVADFHHDRHHASHLGATEGSSEAGSHLAPIVTCTKIYNIHWSTRKAKL